MSVTMTSIAQQADVSVAVVSRLVRGDPTLRISEKRRQEILRITSELGGVKSRIRKRRLAHAITVPVSRIFSPAAIKSVLIETEQFQNFEKKLRAHGFRLHFSFFEPGDELGVFESLVRGPRTFDGTLVLSGVSSEALADLLQKNRFPHVAFDYDAERFQLNTVRVHTTDGMRQAVEHLCALGHQHIGFFGPRNSYRYPLAVAALAGRQLPIDDALNCWTPTLSGAGSGTRRQAAHEPFRQWVDRQRRETGYLHHDACAGAPCCTAG